MKIVCRPNPRRVKSFRRIWAKFYGLHCAYCTIFCSDSGTIDHIIPRSLGGGNSIANLVLACYKCNQEKADRTVAEFRPLMLQPLLTKELQ